MKSNSPLTPSLLLLLFAVASAFAAPITWDGGGDGVSWGDANNWSGNVQPSATSDVTIPVIAGNPTIKTDNLPDVSIHSLSTSQPLNIANGRILKVMTTASSSEDVTLIGGSYSRRKLDADRGSEVRCQG